MKFLVDECLSPKLARLARDRGYVESTHVTWIGLGGMQDWNLVVYAVDGDWIFVTKNSIDFRGPANARGQGGQYKDYTLHPGLVCLNADNMDRRLQLDLFSAVLDDLAGGGGLVNECLEASLDASDSIVVVRYALPVEVAP